MHEIDVYDCMLVLEPEIGQGHIADVLKELYPGIDLYGFEINQDNFEIASAKHN